MLKTSLFLFLLCGPALADSSSSSSTSPSSSVTYSVELATKTHRHVILVADRSCGEIQLKTPQRESFLRVCATAAATGKHVRLEVERRTRDNQDEARQAAVVVATPGSSFDLLDGKLTVKTQ